MTQKDTSSGENFLTRIYNNLLSDGQETNSVNQKTDNLMIEPFLENIFNFNNTDLTNLNPSKEKTIFDTTNKANTRKLTNFIRGLLQDIITQTYSIWFIIA